MNEGQLETLRQHRLDIVNSLEPRGKVLDILLEDAILTENDVERVSTATTRKDRCHLLLSILPTRGPVAYGSFKRALQVGEYEFLAKQLESSDTIESHLITVPLTKDYADCQYCKELLQRWQKQNKVRYASLQHAFKPCFCLFLKNVEPKDIVDHLVQARMMSDDDIDRILSGVTRRERCQHFLETILHVEGHCEVSILKTLTVALSKKYSYIADTIPGGVEDIQILTKSQKTCPRTEPVKQECATKEKQNNGTLKYEETSEKDVESTDLKLMDTDNEITCLKQLNHVSGDNESVRNVKQSSSKSHDDDDVTNTCVKQFSCESQNDDTSLTSVKQNIRDFIDNESSVTSLKHKVDSLYEDNTHLKQTTDHFDTVDGACSNYSLETAVLGTGRVVEVKDIQDNLHQTKVDSMQYSLAFNDFQNTEDTPKQIAADRTPCSVQQVSLSEPDEGKTKSSSEGKELVLKQMTAIHSDKPRKKLTAAFNLLSTFINQGNYDKFQDVSSKLRVRFPKNYDLMCIIGYLQTSMDLFQTKFDSAKSHLNSTMALVPKTSNPRYFMLELFTAKTRMYITQKKLEKLQRTLDEAMMILETDPVGCTGRAAGWLYINHARNQTAQLSCLNLSKPSAIKSYERLFDSAKTSFQRSMTNFKQDGGKDGPFGFGYALCRLVILLLRCGDNGMTMDVLTPTEEDVRAARQYIQHLEDSDIVISNILDMHFRLAKCDYQFRRGNYVRAFEHAQLAHELATDLKLLEFTEHAYNRVKNLRSKLTEFRDPDEMSEEDYNRVLFEESSESEFSVQSE